MCVCVCVCVCVCEHMWAREREMECNPCPSGGSHRSIRPANRLCVHACKCCIGGLLLSQETKGPLTGVSKRWPHTGLILDRCVCVHVCEREREREREDQDRNSERKNKLLILDNMNYNLAVDNSLTTTASTYLSLIRSDHLFPTQ